MKIWAPIKILLIIVASIGAIFDSSYSEVGDKIGWEIAIAGFLFFPCIVAIGLFALKILLRKKLDFEVPSMTSNPLDFSHPEHFFHLGGLIMIVSGMCGLAASYFRTGYLLPVTFAPVAIGTGVLLGIWGVKAVYFVQQRSNKSNQQGPLAGTR